MSITYDSTSIETANIVTRRVSHETTADRRIDAVKLTRRDGEIVVGDSFGAKIITVEGNLIGTTSADLEAKIDTLNELVSRKDKNLDITYASGTRRYVCRMTKVSFDRDYFNINHVPFVINFYIATGLGTDSSETTAKNTSGITAEITDSAITFAGSYVPKPRHKITFTAIGNADVCRISNQDTADYIDVDLEDFSNSDYIEVDEENQTVTKNGTTNLDWRGKFPSVVIGVNNLRLTLLGSGSTLDITQFQGTGEVSVFYDNGTYNPTQYQSFVPIQSGQLHKLSCVVSKDGSPTGKLQWYIRYDDNGMPMTGADSIVDTGVFDIAYGDVPGSLAFTDALLTGGISPYLTKGRKYWITLNSGVITGSDLSNHYKWAYSTIPTSYLYGKAMTQERSTDPIVDGSSNAQAGNVLGQFDMCFKIYRGDGGAVSHMVTWQIYYVKKYL